MNKMKKTLALLLAATMMLPAFACAATASSSSDDSGNAQAPTGGDSAVVNDGGNDVADQGGVDGDGNVADAGENGNAADGEGSDSEGASDGNSSDGGNSGVPGFTLNDNTVYDDNGAPNWVLDFNENTVSPDGGDLADAVVTTMRGDNGQYYVPKTDINGTTVTAADGGAVTEVYTGTTLATTYAEPNYTPAFKSYVALWLDISKRENFVFDGSLLEFEVEVPEDAKDGVYPIELIDTDLGDYDGLGLGQIDTNPGYICVNTDIPDVKQVDNGNLTLSVESVSVKPGDKVRLSVDIKNNTGIVAFVLTFRYDSNAMTLRRAGAGADLASRATLTTRTIDAE